MNATRLLFPACMLLSACATLVNTDYTKVKVTSRTPFVVLRDSTDNHELQKEHTVYVLRSDSDHTLLLAGDSVTVTKRLPVKKDEIILMNALMPGIGLLGIALDHVSKRGYTYPRNFPITISAEDSSMDDYFSEVLAQKPWERRSNFKTTPLKLVGLVNPGFELCYEYPFTQKFSVQLMGSVLYTPFIYAAEFPQNGYRFSIEPRAFLTGNVDRGFYLSFEANFMQKKSIELREFAQIPYDSSPSDSLYWESIYADTVQVNKHTLSFNQKFGYQFAKGSWVLDVYTGIGIRLKSVDITGRIGPNDEASIRAETWRMDTPGTTFTWSLPLNFRIGYRF